MKLRSGLDTKKLPNSRRNIARLSAAIGLSIFGLNKANAALKDWHLNAEGLGPIKLGITRSAAERLLGVPILHPRSFGEDQEDDRDCTVAFTGKHFNGLGFAIQRGRIRRIFVTSPSKIATAEGISIGASDGKVTNAYGSDLTVKPNPYRDLDLASNQWFIQFSRDHKTGIRYATGEHHEVISILIARSNSISTRDLCSPPDSPGGW